MKNPFKKIADALDKAISGGEVDVIVMEEKPLDASVAGELVASETGGEAESDETGATDATGEGATKTEDVEAVAEGEGAENDDDVAGDAAEGDEAAGDAGGESAGDENAEGADAGETPSMASVQQMLGEGEVAIGAAELEQLRADAGEWVANKAELTQLRAWKANGSKPNVMNGAVDAADAVTTKTRKVSPQTQAAIDLQEKMEAQGSK